MSLKKLARFYSYEKNIFDRRVAGSRLILGVVDWGIPCTITRCLHARALANIKSPGTAAAVLMLACRGAAISLPGEVYKKMGLA